MLRLRLTLDSGRITAAEPVIGFMHRGAEKLFEARDYRQIIVLANRHDWLGAFASELGVVLAVERLAGIEVPPRGVWARTLLAELNRVLSHLAFLSSYPPEIVTAARGGGGTETGPGGAEGGAGGAEGGAGGAEGGAGGRRVSTKGSAGGSRARTGGTGASTEAGAGGAVADGGQPARAAFRAREAMQTIMEEVAGGRMHYMFNRVGGLKEELPAGWLGRVHAAVGQVTAALPMIGATIRDRGFRAHTRGVGVLTAEQARQYGVSGPAARSCGVDFDLRRDEPYLAYGDLADVLRVVTRPEGDCLARFECLLGQVEASLELADACASRLARLPRGPLTARVPKVLKVPEGHIYAWTESPLGLNGYYLVSRGGKMPWRLKLRSASFSNVAVLPEVLPGHQVADLPAVLGSLFFVAGDLDK